MLPPVTDNADDFPDPWINRSNCQEQLSDAFLSGVAATAGCAMSRPVPDNDSIDWTISCRLPRRPKLDVQMKSTTVAAPCDSDFRFSLKLKNYNDLRLDDVIVPRILVVVTVPRRQEEWLDLSPEGLVLRYCAYWMSLAGMPRIRNTKSTSVIIPSRNLLTPAVLRELMQRINDDVPL